MSHTDQVIVDQLENELRRLSAGDACVWLDYEFEPETGPLIRLQIGDPYWHFLTLDLIQLLESLPDGVGSDVIKQAIEQGATTVWHGPAPQGSRDTSF